MTVLRKRIPIFLTGLSILFMLSLAWTRISVKANPQIIHVPEDAPTIQTAVDYASPGAIIMVAAGTYVEHFNITKSLSIIGQERETTIIDGSNSDYVISIAADNVAIEGVTITKSVARPYDGGIRVERGRGAVVNNTKIMNTYTGVTLYFTTNNFFLNNVIVNNTNAAQLLYSNSNVFANNTVYNNSEGISLYSANSNIFLENSFGGNMEAVFLASSCSRNHFFHNNFFDPVQVAGGSTNIWSRAGEGNYWSSYNLTDRDLNADGIGEEPYIIEEYNQDDYPLMGMFVAHTFILRHEPYPVTVISNSTISDFTFEIGKETGNRIISFKASGEERSFGFCRMMVPTSLVDYPLTVLDREGEANATLLNISNATNAFLYFTYDHVNQSINVVSSVALQQYNDLLEKYDGLQADFNNLNATYQTLLASYNASLQAEIAGLNTTYQSLLNSFNQLLVNFTQLHDNYLDLNTSYQKNLVDQSESMQNIRNLTYIFAGTTAAFLITTIYLSNRAYSASRLKTVLSEQEQ